MYELLAAVQNHTCLHILKRKYCIIVPFFLFFVNIIFIKSYSPTLFVSVFMYLICDVPEV